MSLLLSRQFTPIPKQEAVLMLWIHRFIASSLNLLVPFQLFAPAQHGVIYGLSELERYLPGRNFGIGVYDRHVQAAGHKKTDLPPQRLYKRPGQRSAASTQARWRAIQETHYATPVLIDDCRLLIAD